MTMTGPQRVETPPTETRLLEVRGLRMHFPAPRRLFQRNSAAVRAVDGVDFWINNGETLGLVGESGSGKSTTGRAILRVYQPTSGSVKFDGVELTELSGEDMRKMRRRMQMILQDPSSSLNARLTVGDIVGEPLDVHNLAHGREKQARVHDLLGMVGLDRYYSDRYPHELSGGQGQRVGIARALATEPDFIVADEPISSLDVSIQAQVVNLLEELQVKFGITFLFIAHDLGVIRHISDRVAVMYLGKIVELADRNALYELPLHPYTKALLSAVPIPDPELEERRERIILSGDIPSPENPPSGCRFHTRCLLRERLGKPEICVTIEPEFLEQSTGHWAACHFSGA